MRQQQKNVVTYRHEKVTPKEYEIIENSEEIASEEKLEQIQPPATYDMMDDWRYTDEEILQERNAGNEALEEHMSKYRNLFPDIFPQNISEHILDAQKNLNYPIPFYAMSILTVFSAAIGNKFKVKLNEGMENGAGLYMVLVANPSVNKSSPLNAAIAALNNYEDKLSRRFHQQIKEYQKLSKEEKENTPEPMWQRKIVGDVTFETLLSMLADNKDGLLRHADEFAGLLKSLNKYRPGDDLQRLLEMWTGGTQRVDRKDRRESIKNPYLVIAGTIQTDVLIEFLTGASNNGFIERLLMITLDKEYDAKWKSVSINKALRDEYHRLVDFVADLPITFDEDGEIVPRILTYTKEAHERIIAWQHKNVESARMINNNRIASIYKKMDIYINRFALIIAVMDYAAKSPKLLLTKNAKIIITTSHVDKAASLVRFCKASAKNVMALLPTQTSIGKTNKRYQGFLDALPEEFDTQMAYKVATRLDLSERTLYYYLSTEHIRKVGHGKYEKKVVKK